MKNKLLIIGIVLILIIPVVAAMKNPAAVYCEELGYDYEINETPDGENGLCVTYANEKIDAWELLDEDSILMFGNFRGAPNINDLNLDDNFASGLNPVNEIEHNFGNININATFNWRDNNGNWLSGVRDQGGCGSCWAFSAMGAIEGKYNINQNDARLDPDLSEQYIVSDCCDAGNCGGGNQIVALNYITGNGVSDEACYSYSGSNSVCNDRCSNYDERLWSVSDQGYESYWAGFTNAELEEWVETLGPLTVAIDAEELLGSPDSDGLYRCDEDDMDHAVVLTGYNDTGNINTSYWIVKNSWGTGWQDSGYGKIAFGECNVADYVHYVGTVTAPNFKPVITLNNPLDDLETNQTDITFNITILNKASSTSTCELMLNGIINQSNTSVDNNTPYVFALNLIQGNYSWYSKCWENDIGIIQNSSTRSFEIINLAPNITSYLPSELSINIAEPNNQSFNLTYDDSEGDSVTVVWYKNDTIVANNSNYTFEGNYLSAGFYDISVTISDLTKSTSIEWILIVNNTNLPPQFNPALENQTILEDNSLSYDINVSDLDNETITYGVNNSDFLISNSGLLTYTPQANWYGIYWINVTASDSEMQISGVINVNVTSVNDAPTITGLENIIVNESALVDINSSGNVMFSDVENDSLTVSYTSTLNSSGQWQTNSSDAGTYNVVVNVSDGEDYTIQNISLIVLDYADIDGDGTADWSDSDDDNDGLNDGDDYLVGNASFITSNVGVVIFVNGSSDLTETINSTNLINFTDGTDSIIEFNYTFGNENVLDISNVTYQKNTSENGVLIYGLEFGGTKNIFLDNSSQKNSICIKDKQVLSFSEFSNNCSGVNETILTCPGSKGDYECLVIGSRLKITNVRNSAVKQMDDSLPPVINSINTLSSGTTSVTVDLNVITDETGECRYNTSDVNFENMTSFSSTNSLSHENEFTYSSDTSGTYYVRCNDTYGNVMLFSNSTSFNVDVTAASSSSSSSSSSSGGGSSSSSSSGGGGGGGAISTTASEGSKTQVLFNLEKGKEYIVSVSKEELPVTKVSFVAGDNSDKSELSVGVGSAPTKKENAYKYIEIKSSSEVSGATIKFKVSKSWLEKYDEGSINLYRYNGGWKKLFTKKLGSDGNYVFYSATTPGFSVFAIAADKIKEKEIIENEGIKKEIVSEERNSLGGITGAGISEPHDNYEITVKEIVVIIFVLIMLFLIFKIISNQNSKPKSKKSLNKKKNKVKK